MLRRRFDLDDDKDSFSPMLNRMKRQSREIEKSIRGNDALRNRRSEVRFDKVVSTGSTLLDLIISGKRIRGGGLPGGIVVEVFGKSSTGKTAILEEIAASTQSRGGEIQYLDPEGRLDSEYAALYGVDITEKNYERPDTVTQLFDLIHSHKFKKEEVINSWLADSLAALSTNMEMEGEDKRGQRRAKEFSEGFRKTCRLIANSRQLVVCSNQVREGEHGEYSPGGLAIPFYSSVRIKTSPVYQKGISTQIKKKENINGKDIEKTVGIRTTCEVIKSSIDDPYRKCNISIIFGYGIDDIRTICNMLRTWEGTNLISASTRVLLVWIRRFAILKNRGIGENSGKW
jgi:RecA/RadA recombinase